MWTHFLCRVKGLPPAAKDGCLVNTLLIASLNIFLIQDNYSIPYPVSFYCSCISRIVLQVIANLFIILHDGPIEIKNQISILEWILSLWTMVDQSWYINYQRMLFDQWWDGLWVFDWTEWICSNTEEEIHDEYCQLQSISIDSVFQMQDDSDATQHG